MKLLNAFSLTMVCDTEMVSDNRDEAVVLFKRINAGLAQTMLLHDGVESCIGHASTAGVLSEMLGIEIPVNRVSVKLKEGEQAIIFQYMGPRLEEGATRLPEGAKIAFFLCQCGFTD